MNAHDRDVKIIQMRRLGFTTKQIARALEVSPSTVRRAMPPPADALMRKKRP